MSQEKTNEAVVRRWMEEVWNQKRPEVIDELMSPKAIAYGMGPNGTALVGIEGFRSAYELFTGALPDVRTSIDQLVAAGDMVCVHMTCRATHGGDHLGIPASGREVVFPVMTMARLQEGKIVEGWNIIDLFSIFRQAGAFETAKALS